MGYKILYGNELLLDPYTDDVVTDAKLTSSINTASYFDFTISPKHSLYNTILERAELVSVYFNKIKLFSGVITEIELDLEGNKSITCTGALDFLGDTIVRPYSTIEGEEDLVAPSSVDGYFQWLIDQHNEHCLDSSKQFVVGVNQGNMLDTNNYIYRASSQRPTTSSEIENKILDSLGGYLFVRYKDDLNILDLYADAHEANTQIIDFGVNITDFTKTTTTDDQYTAVVATGYTPDAPEDDPDKEMDPITLDGCTDGGTPYSPTIVKQGDRVYDINAVARYGYKEYYVSNDDIETYDGLLEYACKTLNGLLSPYLTVTVKAVDLAMYMDNGYEHLQLGQAARVRSKFHGIDEYLMVDSIDIDINDPGNTEYTLGAGYNTLTGQQSSYLKSLNSGINSALDATSALSSETKAAAKDAQDAKNTATDASTTANEAKEAASKAATDIQTEYAQSDSATDEPTSGWSTDAPEWTEGTYIWMRHIVTYGNGSTETTPGVVITGNTGKQGAQGIQGIQGPQGEQGIQGDKGEDGSTSYFHIKYAPVENPTSAQMTETPDVYIGTYVDTTQEDSTDPSKYTWARFQGMQGEQGIPGVGQDGKTSYLHIKYSDDGTTFTDNAGEDPGNYIGQYTDFTQADSTTFSDYTWTLIKGEQGDNGTDGTRGKSVLSVSTYPITDYRIEEHKEDTTDTNVYIWQQDDLKTDTGLSEILVGDTIQVGTHQYVISELDDDWHPSPVSLVDDGISLASDTQESGGTSVAKAVGRSVTRPAILSLATEPATYAYDDSTTAYAWLLSTIVDDVGVYDVGLGDIVQVGDYQYVIDYVSGNRYPYSSPYDDYFVVSRTKTKITGADGQNGADGKDGTDGKDGNGIASTEVAYQTSTSGTETPTGTWTADIPDVAQGKYLWTKTVTTYTDATTSTSYSVAYQATDGQNGADGNGFQWNLIPKSEYLDDFIIEDETYVSWSDNVFTRLTTGSESESRYGIYYDFESVIPGNDYTLSVNFENVVNEMLVGIGSSDTPWWDSEYGETVATEDGRYELSITAKESETMLRCYINSNVEGSSAKVTKVKLEQNANASPWCTTQAETIGSDGISPTIDTSKSGTTTTITIVDAEGTKTATVEDGKNGTDGKDGTDGADGKMLYGTCSTAGATATKVATVTGFTLTAGTTVSIKFTYANSADAPKLNINSLGAKSIITNGTTYAYWAAGASVVFVYDGTQFQVCSSPVYADTVTVGNPSSKNVYIDSDSVDIRTGTTVSSSFSGNAVELGKNSRSAIIKMCGGAATISADDQSISLSNSLGTMIRSQSYGDGKSYTGSMVYVYNNGSVGSAKILAGAVTASGKEYYAEMLLDGSNVSGKESTSITARADGVGLDAAVSMPVPRFRWTNQNSDVSAYDAMNNSSAVWQSFYMFVTVQCNYDAFSSTGHGFRFSELLAHRDYYTLTVKRSGYWDIEFTCGVSNAGTSVTDRVGVGIWINNSEYASTFEQAYNDDSTIHMPTVHWMGWLSEGDLINVRCDASWYGRMYTHSKFSRCIIEYLGYDTNEYSNSSW